MSDSPKHFESLYPENTRSEEISQLIPFIQKGQSVQLVGLPGTGKNNILNLLSYNKEVREKHFGKYETTIHFVYIDCSEIKNRPLTDFIKFVLISLSYSLNERAMIEEANTINGILKEALSFQDELILFQGLKKSIDYLTAEKKLTIIFSLDRFDEALNSVTSQFFANLKILRNRAKYRFSVIFGISRPLEELIDPMMLSEFYDFVVGNIIYVRLHDEVGMAFRLSFLEKSTRDKRDDNVKKEIVRLTGGHGKLTRIAYESVLSEQGKIEKLEEFLLKKPTVQGALFEIWSSLLPSEQISLKGIASGEKNAPSSFIENVGLVENGVITIPLLEKYLTTLSVQSTQKIEYDIDKNDILQGGVSISEKLSPSEFKLLLYLINNTGRICTKDEIIQSVWKEQKTLEGVTDQALDQIFYRLRKKVEEDPANPHYIHTIKGKGYKFDN